MKTTYNKTASSKTNKKRSMWRFTVIVALLFFQVASGFAQLSVSVSSFTNPACNGDFTGTASASVSGGTTPYSYSWTNGSQGVSTSGLSAGNYTITVTDGQSSTATASVTISEPQKITMDSIIVGFASFGCDGSAGVLNVSGGVMPYTYSWTNGETGTTRSNVCACTPIDSVKITDSNNCTAYFSYIPRGIAACTSGTDATCGNNDGTATATATNGLTAPFSYSWSTNPIQTTQTATGLVAGTYTVLITDMFGITATGTWTIQSIGSLSINTSTTPSSCGSSDGTATASTTGGTPGYTYVWQPSTQTTSTATALSPGTYTVVVTDVNNCSNSQVATVGSNSNMIINTSSTPIACYGSAIGTATVTASGGISPYSFSWSNGQTGNFANGLVAGNYSVTITDASNCSVTKTIVITQSPLLTANIVVTSNVCNGSNIADLLASVQGGKSPYSFLWSPGNETTANIGGVAVGATYFVDVTDAFGCTTQASINLTNPTALSINISGATNVTCWGYNNGSASIVATGGVTPYAYSWNNGQTTSTTSGLAAGMYIVNVTDAYNCQALDTITIVQPTNLSINVTTQDVSCKGNSDGFAQANVSGGSPSYTYSWIPTNATTQAISNIAAATYTIIAVDNNGCMINSSIKIQEPSTDCVWPGDANYDQVADNTDLLQIGLGYGKTGATRPNASIMWTGQPMTDWADSIGFVNSKHGDCNGDGTIDANDTTAIVANYGMTHPALMMQSTTGTDLYLNFSADSIAAGSTVSVPVYLGNANTPATNVYGLAFNIDFDSTLVKRGSVKIDLNQTWLGTMGVDLISIQKELYDNNMLGVGITRINHQPITGHGQIGTVSVVMKDDIAAKTYIHEVFKLSFSGVKMIDNNGSNLPVIAKEDSVVVSQDVTGIAKVNSDDKRVRVYPNPASTSITANVSGSLNIQHVSVLNILGEELMIPATTSNNQIQFNIEKLNAGMYMIRIQTTEGTIVKRFQVEK